MSSTWPNISFLRFAAIDFRQEEIFNIPLQTPSVQGKVEIELELITEEEAAEKPAGRAREEPNNNPPLEPPK